ncbi:MAG: hypothetical protein ACE1Z0_01180 [Acidimicrobiia bacterium]
MDLRDVLLVIHIAGAGTWLGANMIQAVVPGLAARQGAEVAAGWYRVAGHLSKRLYMPASILILITGIVLVLEDASLSFGSLFVTIGFGMIVIGALLGIFIFDPGSEVVAVAVESGDQSRIKATTARIATFGTVDTLLVLFTMTAMVLRWT